MTLIDHEELIRTASRLEPLPASVTRLAALVANERVDLTEIERVVATDPILAARVLRTANAAAHGSSANISTLRAAVLRLGGGSVLALALSAGVRQRMGRAVPEYGLAPGQLWRHSVTAAIAAEVLPAQCRAVVPPETLAAALLHDIGKLVLGQFLSAPVLSLLHAAYESGTPPERAEAELLGVDHAEIGRLVTESWRLPDSLVRAIGGHHAPELADDTASAAVHLADALAKAALADTGDSAPPDYEAHAGACARLGLTREGLARCADALRRRVIESRFLYD
jgi:HD-like signal output (HDOD) protein